MLRPSLTLMRVVAATLLVFAPLAFAQSTATLQGTVQDATGAFVPNARVTVHNEGTGEERVTQTDETGSYLVSSLPVGSYRVEVKSAGMQTMVANNVPLEVNRAIV